MLYTYIYIHILYRSIVMYSVRSYAANLDDRVSHEGESAYRVGREISKARAFSNFVDGTEKKKKKKKETRVRAHTNLQRKIYNLFFFLNFTRTCLHLMAIRDRIRKTFLFLRSRTKAMKPHVDESVLTRRSLFGLSKLGFHLFICRVRVFTFR